MKLIDIVRYVVAALMGVALSESGVKLHTWSGAFVGVLLALVYITGAVDCILERRRAETEGRAQGFIAGMYYAIGRFAATKGKAE